jgi:hypothetical protein
VHYGKIPGAEKDFLFKPGAEKFQLTFKLETKLEVTRMDLENGHREYLAKCHVTDRAGAALGYAERICSTTESKYRWRADLVNTGKPVPKEYWDKRKESKQAAQAMIGGANFVPKKTSEGWTIHEVCGRAENPDIADTYNTVIAMAQKRAHVAAIIMAVGGSDLYAVEPDEIEVDVDTDPYATSHDGSPAGRGMKKQKDDNAGTTPKQNAGAPADKQQSTAAKAEPKTDQKPPTTLEKIAELRKIRVYLCTQGFEPRLVSMEQEYGLHPLQFEQYSENGLAQVALVYSYVDKPETDAAREALVKDRKLLAIDHLLKEAKATNNKAKLEAIRNVYRAGKIEQTKLSSYSTDILQGLQKQIETILQAK